MHGIAHVAGAVDGRYLLWLLLGAHRYHGLDERQAGSLFLLGGMDAYQVHDLDLRVVAIGRQEMDGPVCCDTVAAQLTETGEGGGAGDAYLGGEVSDGGRKAHPDDVLYVDVIAQKPLLVVVDVDDARQTVAVLTEVVQERGVLTHRGIAVGGIVVG